MLRGGAGCPVLNLQKRLWALEMQFADETPATGDSPSFFSFQSAHAPRLAGGAPRLQFLQAQLTDVRVRQEHLKQQVDNFTQSPGLAPSPPDWDSSKEDGKGGAAASGARGSVHLNPLPWQKGLPESWPGMGLWWPRHGVRALWGGHKVTGPIGDCRQISGRQQGEELRTKDPVQASVTPRAMGWSNQLKARSE